MDKSKSDSILIIVLLIFCFIFKPDISVGQERINFEQISTDDGLSNGTINDIYRDSWGFMWFCTDDGLNRYDGYTFKAYRADFNENNSFQNIQYTCITEDVYRNIWIGTSEGLFYYDKNNDRIVKLPTQSNQELENPQLNGLINVLFFDSNHYLWAGAYTGVSRIKIKSSEINSIKAEDIDTFIRLQNDSLAISNNNIFSIYEDKQHKIWISTNSYFLDCYDYEQNKISKHKIDIPGIDKLNRLRVKIVADKNDDFWIATSSLGLIHWDRKNNTFSSIYEISKELENIKLIYVRSIMIDHLNRIWIGTDGKGLILYDIEKNEAQHFYNNLDNQSILSSNAIYSIYEDQTGMYWIGTYLMGLNKYDPDKISFGSYHYSSSSKNGLSHNIVTGFCEDKNNRIWISTDGGGINIFNREKDQFSYYKHEKGIPASLSTNTTMSLFRDYDYNIWVGTYIGGINRFDWETQKFVHYFHDPDDSTSLISNSPWSYAQDKMKNIWIGTVDLGLDLLKNGSNTFVHYQTTIANHYGPDQLNSINITQLFIDKSNRLWIGTEYGLDMVDLNLVDFSQPVPELYFNHYMSDSSENSISYNRISYINEDNNNNIWIGTKGGGLNKLDLSTNTFSTYTMKDGLPHNIINGILFDSDNNPWISTNNGLSYFNVKSGKFKNFYASDGLQSSVFIKTSCFKASDGMFFFGGTNGFNCFYPEKIISKGKTLKTVLTDFKLFNQSVTIGDTINNRIVLNKAIYELDDINLFYKENNISFEFSALDYSKPEKIFYSYILEGFDKGWQVTDANMRIAKYTNLSPGKYIFKVKATLNEETWPETATSIVINIQPPWWMKWWFRISVVFFVLAIITMIFLLRVRSLHKQKKVLESTVAVRTKQLKEANDKKDKFLAILAHDLINPFSTILGFTDLLLTNFSEWDEKAKMETVKTINDSSSDLYQLLLNLLEWSRSERGLIEYSPEKIDLNNCINNVLSLQSAMAQAKQITLEKTFQESNYYVKSDIQLLNAILRNLISNAIKFTQKGGKISVRLEPDEKYLTVSITDNGVGMKKQKLENLFRIDIQQSTLGTNQEKGTGIGLLLVKEFVTKQQGRLIVKSEPGKGSTFSFTVPCWSD